MSICISIPSMGNFNPKASFAWKIPNNLLGKAIGRKFLFQCQKRNNEIMIIMFH